MEVSVIAVLTIVGSLAAAWGQQANVADRRVAEQHYTAGWQALRTESFEESAREFQAAIDSYPGFTLAYYGLGRAEMGLKKFAEAARAYENCKRNYERAGGQQFRQQLDANRARQDQEMELKEAIRQTSQGPQNQRSQDLTRQLQNQLNLVRQNADRGMNVSIEAAVPPFVTLAAGKCVLPAGAVRRRRTRVQVVGRERPQDGRSVEQPGGGVPDDVEVCRRRERGESRRESRLQRQPEPEGRHQEEEKRRLAGRVFGSLLQRLGSSDHVRKHALEIRGGKRLRQHSELLIGLE